MSQRSNEIGEFYIIVTALHTHVATGARPYCLVHGAAAILSQRFLYYAPRVELVIIASHRTNHGAFTAIQAETYLGIAYGILQIEHLTIRLSKYPVKSVTQRQYLRLAWSLQL